MTGRDLIVTWPKGRGFSSYLLELRKAEAEGLQINYRVPSRPKTSPLVNGRRARCYLVHSGKIRGYNEILGVKYRLDGEVVRVRSDALAGYWPEGWYIVRSPTFHHVTPVDMKGFQGYHYWPDDLPVPVEISE